MNILKKLLGALGVTVLLLAPLHSAQAWHHGDRGYQRGTACGSRSGKKQRSLYFVKWRKIMMGKNYLTTVAALVIAASVQWVSVPAYAATEQGEQRQEARDTKQTGRQDARQEKAECKAGDDKSRVECRQEKRDTKQETRDTARDIKQQ